VHVVLVRFPRILQDKEDPSCDADLFMGSSYDSLKNTLTPCAPFCNVGASLPSLSHLVSSSTIAADNYYARLLGSFDPKLHHNYLVKLTLVFD
jgi:hypothetical protein